LPSEFIVVPVADFPDQSLERKFPQKEFGGFLIPPNLSEGNGAWSEPMRSFDPASGGMTLSGSLPSKGFFGLLG